MASERPRMLLVTRAIVRRPDGRLLLVRRADHESYHPGKWEFPGGKLDDGQDVTTAMTREVVEEAGLSIRTITPVMFVESFVVAQGPYAGLPYVGLFGLGECDDCQVVLSDEHSAHVWVTPEAALGYDLDSSSRAALITMSNR